MEREVSLTTNINVDYIAGIIIEILFFFFSFLLFFIHFFCVFEGVPAGTELIATARVLKIGRNVAFAEMEIRGEKDNTLYCKGSHTKCMINSSVDPSIVASPSMKANL